MRIKTVWHWRNAAKASALILAAALLWGGICYAFAVPTALAFTFGLVLGAGASLFAGRRWETYHFERADS